MKTITDKMAARGAESLSDAELLAVLTDDEQTAGALLAACGGALARIASEDAARLRMVGGLGLRRARLLPAAAFWFYDLHVYRYQITELLPVFVEQPAATIRFP